jgi:hypothetical protein
MTIDEYDIADLKERVEYLENWKKDIDKLLRDLLR